MLETTIMRLRTAVAEAYASQARAVRLLRGPTFLLVLSVFGSFAASQATPQPRAKTYRDEKVGYTLSYPGHWYPSGIQYGNAFEIRNYDPKNPAAVVDRNRASLLVVDTLTGSAEATDKFLDQFVSGPSPNAVPMIIDGHRAVRIRRKVPARAVSPGVRRSSPEGQNVDDRKLYWTVSTHIAWGLHVISIEASVSVDADRSVIDDIVAIQDSAKFGMQGPR